MRDDGWQLLRSWQLFGHMYTRSKALTAEQLGHRTVAPAFVFVAEAHRYGKRLVVHADEKLTAFLELQSAVCGCGELS